MSLKLCEFVGYTKLFLDDSFPPAHFVAATRELGSLQDIQHSSNMDELEKKQKHRPIDQRQRAPGTSVISPGRNQSKKSKQRIEFNKKKRRINLMGREFNIFII